MISARGLRFVPAVFLAASLIWSGAVTAQTAGAPLVLAAKIPLGDVSGRIDHLGFADARRRIEFPDGDRP